ncbi:MAG: circularly permuted type 2 ATP-grasp protein [Betaproteobacteria bacterium]
MSRQLLSAYPPASARYDEMLDAGRVPREHWHTMFDQLAAAPPELMRERLQAVKRQVSENGITYNVYADAQGADRPWDLDVLPLILPHEEWRSIERAVTQRATLLNRILLDVYGSQYLLQQGLLPPALVYGHAGFLRPAHGVPAQGGTMLHHYAADLARSPDGRWWVVADRTQAPSGAGYALENRLVISRVFPDLFRDLKVQHLASFFAALRDSLAHWAPHGGEAPLIVLLTPGPYNETYFEHAYLARYLGFPLVEGHDLTVRGSCVWLKTLSGLQRVHAILRRLDDDSCDPLELTGGSTLGVAGLADAARRGNVLLANALGSNLLESGALLGFLPLLSRKLLGEELQMPSVGTWWCGEKPALEQVIERLDSLVIKPAFPQLRRDAVFGDDLDDAARAALVARMRAKPQEYVAQEMVQLSQAPVWDREHPRRLLARAIGMRVFACATPNGYVVMPGGLTRVATGPNARVISMQRGGASKDTWVLAPGPVNTFSLLRRATGAQDLVRSGANLSSRVVENLYWFGRYCERCDNTARLLRLALERMIERVPSGSDAGWAGITAMLRRAEILEEEDALDDVALVRALRAAIVDDEHAGLAGNLRQLFRVASQLRERLSLDNWRTVNRLVQDFSERKNQPLALSDALAEIDRTVVALMTLAGFALDGMTRDHGWRFLSVGRRIERMQFQCAALGEALSMPATDGHPDLDWLLALADSTITYRSRYMARPEWMPVLDLLVRDESNPRSVAFQLKGLHDYLIKLGGTLGDCGADALAPSIADLHSLDAARDLEPGSARLAALISGLLEASYALSEQLGLRFFSHSMLRQTYAT